MDQKTIEQEQAEFAKQYFSTSPLSKQTCNNPRVVSPARIFVDKETGRPFQVTGGQRFYLPDSETKTRFAKFRREVHEAFHHQFYTAQKEYNKDKIILKVFRLEENPTTGKRNLIDPTMLGLPRQYACYLRPNGAIIVHDRRTKKYVRGFHHNCLGPEQKKETRRNKDGNDLRLMMINFLTHAMNDKDSRPVIIQAMMKTLAKKPEKLLDLAAKISPKEVNTTTGDPAVIVIE